MKNSIKRLYSIARKEFFHIIHDIRSLIIIFIIPVLMLTMFGYALNMEIQDIDMAVIDNSKSPASREFIQSFEGNNIFNLFYFEGKTRDIEPLLLKRQARAILRIDKNFSKKIELENKAVVQLIIDASDPNAAMMIQNYCNFVVLNYNQSSGNNIVLPIEVKPRIWYNPDMKSSYFFIPGLIALILVMISALLMF